MRLRREVDNASQDTVAREMIARRNLVCATVPVTDLDKLTRDPAIAFIHPFEPLALDQPEVRYGHGNRLRHPKRLGPRRPTAAAKMC